MKPLYMVNEEEYTCIERCKDKKKIKALLTFYNICMCIVNILSVQMTILVGSPISSLKLGNVESKVRNVKLGCRKNYVYFNQNLKIV